MLIQKYTFLNLWLLLTRLELHQMSLSFSFENPIHFQNNVCPVKRIVWSFFLVKAFSLSKLIKKFSGSTAQLAHCGWSGEAELVAQHYSNYFIFATSYRIFHTFNIIQNISYIHIEHDPEYFIFSYHQELYIYQLVYHGHCLNNKDLWHCFM